MLPFPVLILYFSWTPWLFGVACLINWMRASLCPLLRAQKLAIAGYWPGTNGYSLAPQIRSLKRRPLVVRQRRCSLIWTNAVVRLMLCKANLRTSHKQNSARYQETVANKSGRLFIKVTSTVARFYFIDMLELKSWLQGSPSSSLVSVFFTFSANTKPFCKRSV